MQWPLKSISRIFLTNISLLTKFFELLQRVPGTLQYRFLMIQYTLTDLYCIPDRSSLALSKMNTNLKYLTYGISLCIILTEKSKIIKLSDEHQESYVFVENICGDRWNARISSFAAVNSLFVGRNFHKKYAILFPWRWFKWIRSK